MLGGLVFNIGNIGGTALGMNAMFGMDVKIGGTISALIAIAIFLSKRAGVAMDRIVVVLGVLMIAMVLYTAIVSDPPVGEALRQSVLPDDIDFLIITTLIGGTVGGYITYAGAHRLVDSGITGPEQVAQISRGTVTGILVTGVMRVLLFLAVLGVVAGGVDPGRRQPAGLGLPGRAGRRGRPGLRHHPVGRQHHLGDRRVLHLGVLPLRLLQPPRSARNYHRVGFIAVCTAIFLALGKAPVTLLVLAGALNGLILPVGLAVILWVAARRARPARRLRLPEVAARRSASLVWVLTVYLGYESLGGIEDLL